MPVYPSHTVSGSEPLERDDELGQLREALTGALEGVGATVLVEGVAGIGKTSLLRTLAREAQSGARVLAARGAELEGDYAFGVVRQLLEPALEAVGAGAREALLSGAAAPAAVVLGAPPAAPADADRGYDVLHALHLVLSRIASAGPVVLVVDDAHWADEASLRFLAFLSTRIAASAMLLAIGARPAPEWRDPARHEALLGDPALRIVRPRPLSGAAALRLATRAASTAVDPGFAAACHAASGGNPFYLLALLGEAAERGLPPSAEAAGEIGGLGPEAVRRSVLARLRSLPPPADAVARAAAILGERAPLRTVAALAGVPAAEAAGAADRLREVGILDPDTAVAFAHPILRAAVLDLLAPSERAAAHGQAAALLRGVDAPSDAVAAHLLLAEPMGSPQAVATLRDAAADARRRGAPESAIVHLRRALAEPPSPPERARVLLELGLNEALRRDPAAREHLVAAIEQSGDPDDRLRAAMALWTHDSFDGRYEEGVPVLERALAGSQDADPALRLRVELEVARGLRSSLDTASAGRTRIAALRDRLDDAADDDVHRLARALVLLDDLLAGRPADALAAHAERALPRAGVHGDTQLAHIPYYALIYCDRLDRAGELLDALVDTAERRGSMIDAEIGRLWRSLAHLRAGRLTAAEADARSVLAGVAESRWHFGAVAARHFLTETLLERGEVDEARALQVDEDVVAGRGWTGHVRLGRARIALAAGDPAAALDELLLVGRLEERFEAARPAMLPWRSEAALAALALGDRERAISLAGEELALARSFGAPRTLGVALRAGGLATGREDLLAEAVEVLAASPARLEQARAHIELGAHLRRTNRRAEAREHLRTGLDGALRLDAGALAGRARDELRASGARLRREHVSGPEALTGAELRVARLAAAGAPNPEIARTLVVSRKTVEKHLANAYLKLDIASRAELAAALGTGASTTEA